MSILRSRLYNVRSGWNHYKKCMNNPLHDTLKVKKAAIDLGFSSIGITAATPLTEEAERYARWLEMGFHGTMSYMERNSEKRQHPDEILPGVKSVVVVAQNYFTPFTHAGLNSDTEGKISRYSWGDDYHDVMPSKMKILQSHIEEIFPGSSSRIYTDTGPVLEKAWAVRAGIGWQGKHSNIISRTHGSWFFIGVIFTTALLEADEPMGDFCGSCTACLDACPTSAIVAPYLVDGTKCISYWTIETKPQVDIPKEIADNLDSWIFGCDTCQDVCPWNRFSTPTDEERFMPRNQETTLNFKQVLSFTQENFSERFRKSPVKRTKMAGLQRNVRSVISSQLTLSTES